MVSRLRSILVDNTTGTIYTGTSTTVSASKDKIAAGVFPKILKTSIVAPGRPVVIVNGNKPIKFARDVLITNISMAVTNTSGKTVIAASPQGASLTIRIRKVNSSNEETTLGSYSITSNSTTSTNTVSFNLLSTDSIFFDVTSIGSTKPGLGLFINTSYFG